MDYCFQVNESSLSLAFYYLKKAYTEVANCALSGIVMVCIIECRLLTNLLYNSLSHTVRSVWHSLSV
jgi:hypothetical protein